MENIIFKCKFCGKECKNGNSLRNHERLCRENPNRQISAIIAYNASEHKGCNHYTKAKELGLPKPYISDETRAKFRTFAGKTHTEETKKKISESMKKAQKEGRAWNIGRSRWNNEHSWPEKWFISVLENELGQKENIDYLTEMPFNKYSLDFAWPDKKLCIEIDGKQHQEEIQKKRDFEKDKLLNENGWTIFRIIWKDCYSVPKKYIEQAKALIMGG